MEADPIIEWKLKNASNTINFVIVGKLGNGKSATGNSILGWEAFLSKYNFSAITCSSELQGAIMKDGRIVNVIDTPGLSNFSMGVEVMSAEIVKSINLAKDGIHAVLLVFSLKSRILPEEAATIEIMKSLFGDKIADYIILVFTNGDILESEQYSFEDFIRQSPKYLRSIIQQCKNRVVIFDNITKDIIKREEQVNELLSLVELVIVDNGGKSYTNENFAELEVGEKVELSKERFLKQQTEERATQLEALLREERLGRESQGEEIRKLKEDLNEIKRQHEEFKKRKAKGKICAIL